MLWNSKKIIFQETCRLVALKFFGVQRPHPVSLPKKRNEIFWIGNDPPPLSSEVFRKFIEFGTGKRPLGLCPKKTFYRTQVNLGSDLWVRMSLSE